MSNKFKASGETRINTRLLDKFGKPIIETRTEPDKSITTQRWSNGTIIETTLSPEGVSLRTNSLIIKEEDGSFTIDPSVLKE